MKTMIGNLMVYDTCIFYCSMRCNNCKKQKKGYWCIRDTGIKVDSVKFWLTLNTIIKTILNEVH